MSRFTNRQIETFLREHFSARLLAPPDYSSNRLPRSQQRFRFKYANMLFEVGTAYQINALTFEPHVTAIWLGRRLVEEANALDEVKTKLLFELSREQLEALTCDEDLLQGMVVALIDETLS